MKKAKIVTRNGNQVIDFPCRAFKQYLLDNFDADGDGEISPEEAKQINYIVLWHCVKKATGYDDPPLGFPIKVESLAGIEYFENLRGFSCSGCNIKGPLHLSRNNRLTDVICDGNEVTELTLGEQSELTCFYCGNNLIKRLDTSGAPKLAILHCSTNLLDELDLSANHKLEELDCSNNRIGSLDLRNCSDVKKLEFRNNAKGFRLSLQKAQAHKLLSIPG